MCGEGRELPGNVLYAPEWCPERSTAGRRAPISGKLVDWTPKRIADDLYPGKLLPNLHADINFLVGRIIRRRSVSRVYMQVYDVTNVTFRISTFHPHRTR